MDSNEWHFDESELVWRLFRGEHQIIKAAKRRTPYAEYWPTPEQSAFIVNALNAAEGRGPRVRHLSTEEPSTLERYGELP